MSKITKFICATLGAFTLVFGSSAMTAQAQGLGEFNGADFTCLEYTNGLGANASGKIQSQLGHLWVLGYLSGYYKANDTLEMTEDEGAGESLYNIMLQTCREYPQNSLLSISMQALAVEARAMPAAPMMEFTPSGYTCGQHVEARGGSAADANKADLADLWAFAFIQGFKNVSVPDMEIAIENMPALTGAIAQNCEKNPDMAFMDLTALVARAVKIE